MHPPRWYKWLLNITYNGVMLPFNGISFPRKFVNVSEIAPALMWMDRRPNQWLLGILSQKLPFLGRKLYNIIHENDLNIGEIFTCDSRSANRMFLFQSYYGIGCPVAVTQMSEVEQQAYIVQVTFVSWYEEEIIIRRWCIYIYIYVYKISDYLSTSKYILKVSLKLYKR
jgi:hypothetical protein